MNVYVLTGIIGRDDERILGVYEDEKMAELDGDRIKFDGDKHFLAMCVCHQKGVECDLPWCDSYDRVVVEGYDLIPKVKKEREVLSTNL